MTQIRVRDSTNVLRTVTRIRLRDTANVLRTVTRIRLRDTTGTLRTITFDDDVASPTNVVAAASPSSIDAVADVVGFADITTASVTASATGGTGPYTYAWTQVSAAGAAWTINNPASAITSFTANDVGPGSIAVATFRVTATDSGALIDTFDVEATCQNVNTA